MATQEVVDHLARDSACVSGALLGQISTPPLVHRWSITTFRDRRVAFMVADHHLSRPPRLAHGGLCPPCTAFRVARKMVDDHPARGSSPASGPGWPRGPGAARTSSGNCASSGRRRPSRAPPTTRCRRRPGTLLTDSATSRRARVLRTSPRTHSALSPRHDERVGKNASRTFRRSKSTSPMMPGGRHMYRHATTHAAIAVG